MACVTSAGLTDPVERVYLLIHILHMIVEPRPSQHVEVQRAGLNIQKLESVTNDALYAFFHDKESPNNAKKEEFLKEIFRVAKQQERFKNGEIGKSSHTSRPARPHSDTHQDGDTIVYIMATNHASESFATDGDEIDTPADDAQEASYQALKTGTTGQRQSMQPHSIMNDEPSAANSLAGPPLLGPLPVRGPPYGHHQQPMPTGMVHGPGSYVESGGSLQPGPSSSIGMHELGNPPGAMSRRSSAFPSPADYASGGHGGPPPALYQPPPPAPWGSVAPPQSPSTLYGFSPQHPASHSPYASQPSVSPLGHGHHHFVDSSMGGVSSSSRQFDHPPVPEAGMYRGSAPSGATDPAAYANYISPPPGRGLPGDSKDGLGR